MWLMTTCGFFSIVEKPGDRAAGRLTLRARVRADLERLRDEALPGLGPIVEGGGTDYPFRAAAPRGEVAAALANLAMKLDYANFKDAVKTRQGPARAAAYGKVWQALHELDPGETAPAPAAPKAAAAPLTHPQDGKANAFGGVVIDGDGRVLLRRPQGDYDGYVWTFPKGKRDPGESAAQCALRETAEETGYAVLLLAPIPGGFAGGTSVSAYFLMTAEGPQGPFDAETAATRWATPAQARTLIALTRNALGRQRDLAVLDAALATLEALPR